MNKFKNIKGCKWYHSLEKVYLEDHINNGWKPELYTGVKYGCGIYFAKCIWGNNQKYAAEVTLGLSDNEIMSEFNSSLGTVSAETDYKKYLKDNNVALSFSTESGNSTRNKEIQNHFINQGIKAVSFVECSDEIIIVFDTSVIQNAKIVSTRGIGACGSNGVWDQFYKIYKKD